LVTSLLKKHNNDTNEDYQFENDDVFYQQQQKLTPLSPYQSRINNNNSSSSQTLTNSISLSQVSGRLQTNILLNNDKINDS
jgi:hypothetical protein